MAEPVVIGMWITWVDKGDTRSQQDLVVAASRALEENDMRLLSRDEWPKNSRIRYSREVEIVEDDK